LLFYRPFEDEWIKLTRKKYLEEEVVKLVIGLRRPTGSEMVLQAIPCIWRSNVSKVAISGFVGCLQILTAQWVAQRKYFF